MTCTTLHDSEENSPKQTSALSPRLRWYHNLIGRRPCKAFQKASLFIATSKSIVMAPKDIEAVEPTKRAEISNADIIPDAGKVHLGKCRMLRRVVATPVERRLFVGDGRKEHVRRVVNKGCDGTFRRRRTKYALVVLSLTNASLIIVTFDSLDR